MHYSLYKVRIDKLSQWLAWCEKLNNELRIQATDTLVEENLLFESFVTFQVGSDWFSMGLALANGDEQLPNPANPINQLHKQNKLECLSFVSKGESSYLLLHPHLPQQK